MKYYIYILFSLKSGIRYVGLTKDIDRRLKEHNGGKSKFTKGHIPWELKHFEEFATRTEAREREKYLKSGVGREYLNKILAS
ncbi:GIY-YIG nuclease family protein [Arcticibacterium luteifluviistationis]|uniref:Endonuclease n=1 Tax=Arcticibacterium luteifluviistationis TaxID=1784714 RepID=A0A2Z4GGB3_9BACT|nr:GIY-YIG nuclease family protein [Arcticibacterium luteifluviistationis]AWW00440.1 endonuclease [Arcticibacterium luteifluviistationis]